MWAELGFRQAPTPGYYAETKLTCEEQLRKTRDPASAVRERMTWCIPCGWTYGEPCCSSLHGTEFLLALCANFPAP